MGMKLYYGGFGDYKVFVAAENEAEAIKKAGEKINAPFLPVTVEEISEVDGFAVTVGEGEKADTEEPAKLRHCKLCDFTCESQGDLMRHYKECHPKGD